MSSKRSNFGITASISGFLIVTAGLSCFAQSIARGVKPDAQTESRPAALDNGNYYALVIGIDRYRNVQPLRTAAEDAQEIARVLSTRYGFQVKLLIDANATRDNIIDALDQYEADLRDNDNLLIYYAGHGQSKGGKAYWWPVDANSDSMSRWISADDITTNLNDQHARHVLVISDSCYAGSLMRAGDYEIRPSDQQIYVQRKLANKSRTLMASGGNEPVADAGANGHSVFANAVIHALSNVEEERFTARDLFVSSIEKQVTGKADQMPLYGQIRNSGDDGEGDFVFVRGKIPGAIKSVNGPVQMAAAPPLRMRPEATNPSSAPAATSGGSNPAQQAVGTSDMELYQQALMSRDPAVMEDLASKISNPTLANVLKMRAQSIRSVTTMAAGATSPASVGGTAAGVSASRAKAQATYDLSDAHHNAMRGNYAKALPIYQRLAEAGNSEAMVDLGNLYYNGYGVTQDYAQAAKWYEKAAELGETKVMSSLGLLYATGHGVPQDDKLAVEWDRKAAAAGDSIGMLGLGFMYEHGRGVPRDLDEAAKWYEKAAALGNQQAKENLQKMGRAH